MNFKSRFVIPAKAGISEKSQNSNRTRIIEEYFKIEFSEEEKQKWREENIIQLVKKKRNDLSERDIKNKINKEVANKISKNSFEEMEAWEEIQGWFKKMKEMNEKQ